MEAIRLFAAVERYREQHRIIRVPIDHPHYAQDMATAHAQLDEATFHMAWAEGRTLSLEQAVTYALETR